MPITPTYANVSKYAWILIKGILENKPRSPLMGHLGQAGMAALAPHFPTGHIRTVKFRAMPEVPAPDLYQLFKNMGYKKEPDFKSECNKTHKNLYEVLRAFSQGSGFNGIAYNDTVYLKHNLKDELNLILHETVHTLQWYYYGPEVFLQKYIEGFSKSFPNYKANPAEKIAYGFEGKFRNIICNRLPQLRGMKLTLINAKNVLKGGMDQVTQELAKLTPLGINKWSATKSM